MTTTHYFGVWMRDGRDPVRMYHDPRYIVRAADPRLAAAAELFQNNGSSEEHARMIEHMRIDTDSNGNVRAMIETGEQGVTLPFGSGGEPLAVTAVKLSPLDAQSYKEASWPLIGIYEEHDRVVHLHDIRSAKAVLDRLEGAAS